MIDVTGLKLGSACKATLEAILTAERIPMRHISLVLLFSVDIIPDDLISCFLPYKLLPPIFGGVPFTLYIHPELGP